MDFFLGEGADVSKNDFLASVSNTCFSDFLKKCVFFSPSRSASVKFWEPWVWGILSPTCLCKTSRDHLVKLSGTDLRSYRQQAGHFIAKRKTPTLRINTWNLYIDFQGFFCCFFQPFIFVGRCFLFSEIWSSTRQTTNVWWVLFESGPGDQRESVWENPTKSAMVETPSDGKYERCYDSVINCFAKSCPPKVGNRTFHHFVTLWSNFQSQKD